MSKLQEQYEQAALDGAAALETLYDTTKTGGWLRDKWKDTAAILRSTRVVVVEDVQMLGDVHVDVPLPPDADAIREAKTMVAELAQAEGIRQNHFVIQDRTMNDVLNAARAEGRIAGLREAAEVVDRLARADKVECRPSLRFASDNLRARAAAVEKGEK
jgi:hypothetical protein